MTGTAATEAEEFEKIYDLEVVSIPTNLPVIRDDRYIGFISKSKLLTAYRRKLINFTI